MAATVSLFGCSSLHLKGNAALTKRLAHKDVKRRSQVHAKFSKQCVRLRFQICVHADTDVCGISSHTINPFLLAIIVYAICTKKTILCTNI